MKAKDCVRNVGDMAVSKLAGVSFAISETPGRVLVLRRDGLNGTYGEEAYIPCDDWQPLLTEAEWRARYPLSLRKLGEGEEIDGNKAYVAHDRVGWKVVWRHNRRDHEVVYEIPQPPLPPAESEEPEAKHVPMDRVGTKRVQFTEPTPMPVRKMDEEEPITEKVESLAGEVTPPWTRKLQEEHAPPPNDGTKPWHRCPTCGGDLEAYQCESCGRDWRAEACSEPNPVGERLTEPPEVGTAVIGYPNSSGVEVFIGITNNKFTMHEGWRYYRWLGPIPQEPTEPTEPEKPEPPKWLGAMRCKKSQNVVWVSAITDIELYSTAANGISDYSDVITVPNVYTLAPDIMPPSPELAKLFGEEVTDANV